ncbi:PTS sugar transporter subunit IIA [Rhodoferax antarcticus]|uniref:Phosphotransferase system IIA component family protein n=1 Tax=Rhodoferax antarcticus ANT.BR TaxID=1111071 RepID=A0A1Q8YIN1_9BURK|nr:PTS fructose transporter subunit IIA [Rhodoferax antarcticus]APW48038.1 PTS fructose transporter subunit IIA [Rhodoferax antarcticus]MCW2313918.1 PTS system ascorbate-specific IIA component [Rhodoferax antarcticus]OLP07876.1 phosphotransferase system IIA component family protein [Rhodoferax antarcticus ANT.BR]
MNNGIFIIAHAPLASALRECVLHVFPDSANGLTVYDVQPNMPTEESLEAARWTMSMLSTPCTLILADVFGATPCNIAQKLADDVSTRLIAGVNVPMLMRAVTYRHESMDALVARALAGGTQGVMLVAVTAPQNQKSEPHDPSDHNHQ